MTITQSAVKNINNSHLVFDADSTVSSISSDVDSNLILTVMTQLSGEDLALMTLENTDCWVLLIRCDQQRFSVTSIGRVCSNNTSSVRLHFGAAAIFAKC